MQAPLDIRYAGVNIGRAQEVRAAEGEDTYFLPGKEPMPVGTVLRLRTITGETPARVVRAVESSDPALCGMQVRLVGDEEAVAADVIPPPAPAKPKPIPAPPVAIPAEPPAPAPAPAPESAAIPQAVPVAVGSSLTGALARAAAGTPAEEPKAAAPAMAVAEAEAVPTKVPEATDDPDIVLSHTPAPISTASVVPVVAPFEGDPALPPAAPAAEASAPVAAAPAPDGEQAAAGKADEKPDAETADEPPAPSAEPMPPARAIAGASSRRKTKRRRSS